MEDKIIELYDLGQETAALLRKEADAYHKDFTIKPSDSLSCKIIFGMFVRNLQYFSQQNLAKFKQFLEKASKKERAL
ncbi:hypothetical protein MF1_02770 [Bartonella quintana]|nr:hypothetical protein RM11_0256 [Bartonella quintana RM-11]AFR26352.1 hypothetical protein RM11_0623 [Bartonella quintana RM-11]BBL53019.1 hypothetical protein MF1_02770 [Bartonella quintana]